LSEWDRLPPTPSRSLRSDNFPEGKVLLHSGKVRYKDFSVESPKSTITFKHPCVVYIIPSHLQKWQDRIKKHVDECKDYTEARCNANIDCYVIRCAKRSVDAVVTLLKKAEVYSSHYTLDDLPQIENSEQRQRSSSKTSVYKWLGTKFDETKMEPDYLAPAYYIQRIGISTEVSFEPSSDSIEMRNRVRRFGQYNFEGLLKAAKVLGIYDETIPLYRVTENQADRIEKQAPSWLYLPDVIFEAAEKRLKAETGILDLRQSNLYGSSLDYRYDEKVVTAYKPNSTGENMVRLRTIFSELAAADPVYRIMLGFRLAKAEKKDGDLLTGDEALANLLKMLGMEAEVKESNQLEKINALTTHHNSHYEYLALFFSNSYHSGANDHLLKHVEMYATALIKDVATHKHNIDPSVFTILEPFGAYFDERSAKFNPVTTEEEINDEAA
jgi:hypothetical protein